MIGLGVNHSSHNSRRPSISTKESFAFEDTHDQAPLRQNAMPYAMASSAPSLYRKDTSDTVDVRYPDSLPPLLSASTYTQSPQTRPPPLTRVPSVQTRYMEMLLHAADAVPRLHNILAAVFTWILLASFLVVPGTFTSFRNSDAFKQADEDDGNKVAHAIVHSIAHIGLLAVSAILLSIGGLGCFWLWYVWRLNYVWLINRIFLYVLHDSYHDTR